MNWEAIVAISEVVGVVGLILSIVYLGVQTRHGARVASDSAFQGVFSLALSQNRGMIQGDTRDVVIKGLLGYEKLVGSEKLTFDTTMIGFVTVVESALLSNDMELLDDQQPEGFAHYLRTRLLPYSGVQAWWSESRHVFERSVQVWMTNQIERTDMTSDFFGVKAGA